MLYIPVAVLYTVRQYAATIMCTVMHVHVELDVLKAPSGPSSSQGFVLPPDDYAIDKKYEMVCTYVVLICVYNYRPQHCPVCVLFFFHCVMKQFLQIMIIDNLISK